MAKSDSDSNGLRQDQPECSPPNGGGLAGDTPLLVCTYRTSATSDRPSVTELSGLTSDPILTADRRGGILISFGPHRTRFGVINPSDLVGSRTRGPALAHRRVSSERPRTYKGVGPRPATQSRAVGRFFAFHPSALIRIRASDRSGSGRPVEGTSVVAFHPSALSRIRASDHVRPPSRGASGASSRSIRAAAVS